MNDDEYYDFCMTNRDVRFERTAQGEIVIVPAAGGESDYQCVQALLQSGPWAMRDGRGKAFGSSVEFHPADRSRSIA
jgi:Uma2 family endonuclease